VTVILLVALRGGERLSALLAPGTDEALLLAVFGLTLLVGGLAQQLQVSAAVGAFLVGLALSGRGVTVGSLASFGLLLAAAVLLLYALNVAMMALAVVLVGAEELGEVSFAVVELGRFPVQLYRNPVQTVLTVVPVAFLTTYPAEALLGRLEPWLLLVSPAVALGALVLASLAWRRTLLRYTGASA